MKIITCLKKQYPKNTQLKPLEEKHKFFFGRFPKYNNEISNKQLCLVIIHKPPKYFVASGEVELKFTSVKVWTPKDAVSTTFYEKEFDVEFSS